MIRVLFALLACTAVLAVPTERAIAQKGGPKVPTNKGHAPTKVSTGNPAIRVETHESADRFAARLGGSVRTVDFDDIETGDGPVPFAADRYKEKLGIVITGQDGQFAGRTFQYPRNYVPRSKPNMYAPGPRAKSNGPVGDGGKQTVVTFFDGKQAGAVCGFGAHFIDVNYPSIGKSAIIAYDADGRELAREEGFRGATGEAVFRGLVALDRAGSPVPVIAKVVLVNGSGWPEVYANEGVTLDDFVFSVPSRGGPAPVAAKGTDGPGGTKAGPDDPLSRAHAARLAGRLDDAVRLYGEVLRRDPTVLEAYLGRGECYRRQHKPNESVADYSRVIELAPNDPRGYASRGTTYVGAAKLDEALRDLNRAIALNSQYAFAYRMRAEALLAAGHPEQALADISRAIQFEPGKAEYYFVRGCIRFDRGDTQGAWADAAAAIRVNAKDSLGYYLKAVVCTREERYDRALAALDQAVELEPTNPGLHAERAAVLARLGRGDDALRSARRASEVDPRHSGNHRGLGMSYWALGKFREAVSAFGQAIAADPRAADNYEIRALCNVALGQPGLAEGDILKVMELTPDQPRAHDAAARYYRAIRDPRADEHEARAKELRQKMVRVTGD